MKGPNPSVGTVPCPIDGQHTCTVHKFQPRHATDAGRRKAGKFYLKCPGHGRLGFDGDPWIQEHVLEHITWAEGSAPPDATVARKPAAQQNRQGDGARPTADERAAPARPPAKKPAPVSTSSGKQTGSQTQTPPAKKPGWWEDLL